MAAERTTMRQVREVLRLKFVGGVEGTLSSDRREIKCPKPRNHPM